GGNTCRRLVLIGRGLDGYLIPVPLACCAVLKARGGRGLYRFPVAMARGKHLFPFRTEQLSPSAPMVLGPQGPGRVGRRRFLLQMSPVRSKRAGLVAVLCALRFAGAPS